MAASIAFDTDYRLRGYTISAGEPVATAAVSYDDRSGLYAILSATDTFGEDGPRFLGFDGAIGYAVRIAPQVSLDAGLHRTQYRAPYSGGTSTRYTEGYVGVTAHSISARIFYSPDYRASNAPTFYGELDTMFQPAPDWRVSAHVGALVYADGRPSYYRGYQVSHDIRYDWRFGLSRRFGRFEAHAALSGGGPGKTCSSGGAHDRTALTAGASWNF